jgi:hypothetical protein
MNHGTFLAVVILIAVIVGYIMLRMLIRKGVNTAAKSLNKNVLFKAE